MTVLFFLSYHPAHLVSKPGTPLLFFLVASLVLERLELLLAQCFATSLGLQTATVVGIGSSINIEEGSHLTLALVLVIVHFGAHASLLELASETVELG